MNINTFLLEITCGVLAVFEGWNNSEVHFKWIFSLNMIYAQNLINSIQDIVPQTKIPLHNKVLVTIY